MEVLAVGIRRCGCIDSKSVQGTALHQTAGTDRLGQGAVACVVQHAAKETRHGCLRCRRWCSPTSRLRRETRSAIDAMWVCVSSGSPLEQIMCLTVIAEFSPECWRRARLPGRGPLSLRVGGSLRIAGCLHIGLAEKRGADHGAVADHLVVALLLGHERTVIARNVLTEDGRAAGSLRC